MRNIKIVFAVVTVTVGVLLACNDDFLKFRCRAHWIRQP